MLISTLTYRWEISWDNSVSKCQGFYRHCLPQHSPNKYCHFLEEEFNWEIFQSEKLAKTLKLMGCLLEVP